MKTDQADANADERAEKSPLRLLIFGVYKWPFYGESFFVVFDDWGQFETWCMRPYAAVVSYNHFDNVIVQWEVDRSDAAKSDAGE